MWNALQYGSDVTSSTCSVTYLDTHPIGEEIGLEWSNPSSLAGDEKYGVIQVGRTVPQHD